MLALLAVNGSAKDLACWYFALLCVLSVIVLGVSIWFLYQASFPRLTGGNNSLVYFREIARRTEGEYLKAMKACEVEQFADDILGQVWRNSEILTEKFAGVKWAFICTALGIAPWFLALVVTTVRHAQLIVK
jgi:hypothetical protein